MNNTRVVTLTKTIIFVLSSTLIMKSIILDLPRNTIASASEIISSTTIDDEHYRKAREIISKSIKYLRSQQDQKTGGWCVYPDRPVFPGITALIINGMLLEPDIDETDPCISKAIDFIITYKHDDGGIYDRILPNYNTALSLSALSLVNRADAVVLIEPGQKYLKSLQWDGQKDLSGNTVDKNHSFYGGAGYGDNSRPDNSNLNLMLQALYDTGLDCNDEAFKKAVVFLERTQMLDEVNDMPYADGSKQGGFIYATAPTGKDIGVGESKAGKIEETQDEGSVVSRLRCYGSMTYAGFKSYIYAHLDRDDIRVKSAYRWIRRNYTVDENPGVGMQGYYYYLLTFSRTFDAWGTTSITTLTADGTNGEVHDWANELIDKLEKLQKENGSFINEADRWMEGDPVLVTAYAVLALQYAID